MAHAAADLDFERLGLRFLDLLFQIYHDRFGSDVALAVRAIDGDGGVVDFVADQEAQRFFSDAPEHVEDGKLDRREGNPEREALQLVVALVNVNPLEQVVQIARVLADEERLQSVHLDRGEGDLLRIVGDGNALGAILGADAAEEAVAPAEQLERFDHHGRGEELPLQHGLFQDFIQLRIVGFDGVGTARRGGARRQREGGGSTAGEGGGEESATIGFHGERGD